MKQHGKYRVFALSSLMTAFALIFTALGTFLPSMGMSMAALAGFCPLVSLMAGGKRASLMSFAASGLLCFILGLSGEAAWTYVCLFGLYPTVKELSERSKNPTLVWLWKLLYANAALALLLGLSLLFIPGLFETEWPLWILWLLYEITFVLYDYAMSRVRAVLLLRIPWLRHGNEFRKR